MTRRLGGLEDVDPLAVPLPAGTEITTRVDRGAACSCCRSRGPPGSSSRRAISSADGSRAYWEIGKTIRQALRADPNTLEMLFAATGACDDLGARLLAVRDAFVSTEIYGSFGHYALSQLERLEHNQRLAEHRAILLDWLRADPTLGLDAVAHRLADAAQIVAPTRRRRRSRASTRCHEGRATRSNARSRRSLVNADAATDTLDAWLVALRRDRFDAER